MGIANFSVGSKVEITGTLKLRGYQAVVNYVDYDNEELNITLTVAPNGTSLEEGNDYWIEVFEVKLIEY